MHLITSQGKQILWGAENLAANSINVWLNINLVCSSQLGTPYCIRNLRKPQTKMKEREEI
jgi:hypothetical protein